MVIIPLTDQDYSPTVAQLGSLQGDFLGEECFEFIAFIDDIVEVMENFIVSLEMANNVIMSGTGAITVDDDNDEVTVTIIDVTSPTPPTGPEVEGINTCTYMYVHMSINRYHLLQ